MQQDAARQTDGRSSASWHRRPIPPAALMAGILVPICVGTFLVYEQWRSAMMRSDPPTTGTLTVGSQPSGVDVVVDRIPRGPTPLTVTLQAGNHTMTLRHGSEERIVSIALAAGADIQHYFDFTLSVPAALVQSSMSVTTDPPRARVTVDGVPRGLSPVTIEGVSPGEHRVTATTGAGSAERTVTVEPGRALSIVFALPSAAAPPVGWLKISAPFEVEFLENGELLGTNASARIMLPAGVHDIALINETLGYRKNRKTEVAVGRTTTVTVEAPRSTFSVNAKPWAEVSVDGAIIGQTPIANATVAIGTHEVVFRHPQLGERRQTVVVTLQGPNRIGMDLTK